MTPELEALARRAVACLMWRWMPGMLAGRRRVVHAEAGAVAATSVRMLPSGGWAPAPVYVDDLPDLADPATLGCLLALVREAWGDPGFYAAQSGTKIKGTDIFGWDTFGYLHGRSRRDMLYRSEAEALVAALETGGGGA